LLEVGCSHRNSDGKSDVESDIEPYFESDVESDIEPYFESDVESDIEPYFESDVESNVESDSRSDEQPNPSTNASPTRLRVLVSIRHSGMEHEMRLEYLP